MNKNKKLVKNKKKKTIVGNYNLYIYNFLKEEYEKINKLNENEGRKTQKFLNIIACYFSELHSCVKTEEAHKFLEGCFNTIADNMKSGGDMLPFDIITDRFEEVCQVINPIEELIAIYKGVTLTILCDPFTFYPEKKKKED